MLLWLGFANIVARATFGTLQLVETVADTCHPRGPLALQASFDEFNLDLDLRYEGALPDFPETPPSPEALLATDTSVAELAGFLIRRSVDRLKSECKNGQCWIQFHFDH